MGLADLITCGRCLARYAKSESGFFVHPVSETCSRSGEVIGPDEMRLRISWQLASYWSDETATRLGGSSEDYADPSAYACLTEEELLELARAVGACFTIE